MPIYEFHCPSCDIKFELLRPFSRANEPAHCPHCRQEARKKVSSFVSLTRGSDGVTAPVAGSSGCGGCSATSCATCH